MEDNKDELEDDELEGGCDCSCCHHHCGAPEAEEEEVDEGGRE